MEPVTHKCLTAIANAIGNKAIVVYRICYGCQDVIAEVFARGGASFCLQLIFCVAHVPQPDCC